LQLSAPKLMCPCMCRDVMPGLAPSEAQLFSALADFDGDGYVSVEDLQAAGGSDRVQVYTRPCLWYACS
jgi:hypothetical protein